MWWHTARVEQLKRKNEEHGGSMAKRTFNEKWRFTDKAARRDWLFFFFTTPIQLMQHLLQVLDKQDLLVIIVIIIIMTIIITNITYTSL